jgi:HEAT repeat protein
VIVLVIALLFAATANSQSGKQESIDRARQVLNEGVTNSNPDVRKEAALAIGFIGQREPATSLVVSLLRDKDVQVRLAAIASLTDLKDRRAIPELKSALDDPVPEVAFAAAKALWAMKQPSGKDLLFSVLEGESKAKSNPVRQRFRDTLRTMKIPKSAFLFVLKEGFGFVPVPGVGVGFGAMQSLFWDKGFSPRASVVLLLAQDPDRATREALLRALSDGDWSVRAAAAQAIALRNQPALARNLLPLLDDKNDKVRYRAAAGYLRLEEIGKNSQGHGNAGASPRPNARAVKQ